ncbi:MAG: hypothetical protein M3463_19210 [Verrucomicrobiota bacterium]|nr:hypothetical protein [Verrucomicrobiota bacterium]
MNPFHLLLVSVVSCSLNAALEAAEAPGSPPAENSTYQLQTKSTFHLPAETRSPFWPIGWSPAKNAVAVAAAAPKKIPLDPKDFALTSILLDVPLLAVINGRAYSEGEFLRTLKKGETRRIRVQRITDGSVTLQHEDQTLVVLLRRSEVAAKKPGQQELLIDER